MSAEASNSDEIDRHPAGGRAMFASDAATYQTETRYVRPDGEAVWTLVSTSIVKDPTRFPEYVPTRVEDLVGRRKERADRARGHQQAAVAELSGRVLAGISQQGLMNEAADALLGGLSADCAVVSEARGLDGLVVVAGVGRPASPVDAVGSAGGCYAQARYTLGATGPIVVEDLTTETRFEGADMVQRGLVSGLSVIVTAHGMPFGVLGAYTTKSRQFLAEDVHFVQAVANVVGMAVERHRHVEAQERARQQERLAAVGQLAAGVAHDFNNIVAAISLYAELLETQQDLDDAGRSYVGAVRQQVERGTSLVWQVLDFAHRSSLEPIDVDLAGFLGQLVPLLRRTLQKHVRLTLEHDGRPYPVRADTTRLQQIFMNLVSNASHAIEGPGQVTIVLYRVGVDADAASPLDNPLCQPSVRVEITDDGGGMSAEVLARAFEPFFTTKNPGQGTGLGLAQVQGLVVQHDGHIDLASVQGEGTKVSIWLPAPQSPSLDSPAKPSDIPRGRGERVLVVDDDPAMRAAMARVLDWLGYHASVVDSGEVACSILAREGCSIAALVSDVKMPGMGGESLAEVVATRWPEKPVILVSGYPTPIEPGAAAVRSAEPKNRSLIRLHKPFSSRQLAGAMITALDPS